MTHYLTNEKLEEFKKELETLMREGRNEIAERLKKAKEFGDLSENAEYSEAKEAQSKIETRIIELENIIRNSTIITKERGKGVVDMGVTVIVKRDGKTYQYTIVGPEEADPSTNHISNESPLGKAFMGKRVGDKTEAVTGKGTMVFEIIEIK